ncbi:MAG: hypothetical protein HY849_00335 [Nitrosomonadales bacterium]|nr:hypothetical protein [Nitrosomonadales bacterium]
MINTAPRKRTPKGVESKKPIKLSLTKDELNDAEKLSKQLGLAKATFARKAYLVGAPLVVSAHNQAASEKVHHHD